VASASPADTWLTSAILLRQVGKPARWLLPACLHPDPPRHIVLHSCGLRPSSCPDVAPPFDGLTFSPNCPAPGSSPPRPTPGPTIRPHSPAPAVRGSRKPSQSRGPRRYRPHRARPACFQCLSVRRPLRFRFEWTAVVLCALAPPTCPRALNQTPCFGADWPPLPLSHALRPRCNRQPWAGPFFLRRDKSSLPIASVCCHSAPPAHLPP